MYCGPNRSIEPTAPDDTLLVACDSFAEFGFREHTCCFLLCVIAECKMQELQLLVRIEVLFLM